jgi:uncharacterized membrane protein
MNIPLFFDVLVGGLVLVGVLWVVTQAVRRQATRHDDPWSSRVVSHNPDDPALFVPKQSGLGWTLNVGHPLGKVVVAALILALAVGALIPVLVGAPLCHGPGCPSTH